MGFVDRLTGKPAAQAAGQAGELQATAATEAAQIGAQSQREALAETQRQFGITQEQLAPFRRLQLQDLRGLSGVLSRQRRLGGRAQRELSGLLGLRGLGAQETLQQRLLESPAQQAIRNRQAAMLERRASATGGLGGGAVLQELFEQGRALDQSTINQRIQQLTGLSGLGAAPLGTDVTGLTAQLGQQQALTTGQTLGNIGAIQAGGLTGAAQAQASGLLGGAQAQAQGAQNLLSAGTQIGSAIALSDKRLKKNIVKVGEKGGYGVYDFNYIWGGPRFRGVMAQEVIKTNPKAVITLDNGYMAVNYGAL